MRHSRSPRDGEAGFTIVESMVALVIVFGLMLVLLRTFDAGTRVLIETKRQSAASAFASELLERARSLEWSHMGLAGSVKGSDCLTEQIGCYIPDFGGDLTYNAGTDEYKFGPEVVVFANADAFKPFLNFHEQVERDDTIFDRYIFITSVRSDPADPETERYRRLTAVVQWLSPRGFRDEVRLTTIVSPFLTPSQPLIDGLVALDGGSISITGRAAGTTGYLAGLIRQDLKAAYVYPRMSVTATSDYVSGATVRSSSSSGSVTWAGLDGLLGTADDVVTRVDPVESFKPADNDAASAPPLNDGAAAFQSLTPAFVMNGLRPSDFTAADITAAGDLDVVISPDLDTGSISAQAWTEHDPGAGTPDKLPYGKGIFLGPDQHALGFMEYLEADVQAAYAAAGFPLSKTRFDFPFVIRGTAGGIEYEGTVDRKETAAKLDQIESSYRWDGDVAYLLYDEVYAEETKAKPKKFQGWVKVTLPDFKNNTVVAAGQGSPVSIHSLVVARDLRIEVWNPTTGQYDVKWDPAVKPLTGQGGAAQTVIPVGPIVKSITPAGAPRVTYTLSGQLEVNGWSYTNALDLNGDLMEANMVASRMVTGTLVYNVFDNVLGRELYDIVLTFDLGGLTASAVYADPEAAP